MATLNPEFFRVFEFEVTMPGESQLKLKLSSPRPQRPLRLSFLSSQPLSLPAPNQLYDYDRFGADELIGETVIDLEDRCFSRRWHDLESQDPVASERRGIDGPYKPLELRDLSVPTSANPQGQV
ncbi:unnamed protein product, partial [Ectocarpus sp. 13 AM-2016]